MHSTCWEDGSEHGKVSISSKSGMYETRCQMLCHSYLIHRFVKRETGLISSDSCLLRPAQLTPRFVCTVTSF